MGIDRGRIVGTDSVQNAFGRRGDDGGRRETQRGQPQPQQGNLPTDEPSHASPGACNPGRKMARPERFELPTLRFEA